LFKLNACLHNLIEEFKAFFLAFSRQMNINGIAVLLSHILLDWIPPRLASSALTLEEQLFHLLVFLNLYFFTELRHRAHRLVLGGF
jgi:hypothetical protein